VPGNELRSIAWEAGSLRIGLAVDNFLYFANIRHDYNWAFFANTLIYTFPKTDRKETAIMFFDIKHHSVSDISVGYFSSK
jgi:WD repeat-containing protein 35